MGEDTALATVTAVKKQIKSEMAKLVDTQIKPLRDARKTQIEDAQNDRVTTFKDQLAELVPNFAEIDESDEWRAWLAEENDDGIERQKILDKHIGVFNADRTASMFKAFLKTQGRPVPPITPNGSGAAPASVPAKQTHLAAPTSAEIKEFYKRSALSKVSPQEVKVFEERMKLL